MTTVTKIIDKTVDPIEADLDGWVKQVGNPTMKTWIEYKSEDGTIISGRWEATAGTYFATYSGWEFIHIMEGKAIVTAEGGEPLSLAAGDSMIFEKDFVGTWEIIDPITKHFAIKF